jgi:hypothetical protein
LYGSAPAVAANINPAAMTLTTIDGVFIREDFQVVRAVLYVNNGPRLRFLGRKVARRLRVGLNCRGNIVAEK